MAIPGAEEDWEEAIEDDIVYILISLRSQLTARSADGYISCLPDKHARSPSIHVCFNTVIDRPLWQQLIPCENERLIVLCMLY